MRLLHQLLIARKYERPDKIGSIYINPAWRQDNSRSLWEAVTSSPEANAALQTEIEPDWILVTPPRSGVFLDFDEAGRELYVLHADTVLRVIPWTLGGEMPKTLGKRLLVTPDEAHEKHAGLIEIPKTALKRPTTGVIVDVGDECENPELAEGVRILYPLYAGTDLEVNGEKRILIEEKQAMMILEEGTEVRT